MNDDFKERFNYLISLSNNDLRKEIENSNWVFILQELRYAGETIEAYENMKKEALDYLHNLRNFKIKYNKKSATNPIEEELFASDKDFIKDLLNILNKVGGSDE